MKKITKKTISIFLILVLMVAVLTSCAGNKSESNGDGNTNGAQATKEKIIRLAVSGTPEIDPAVGLYISSSQALVNLYDSLVIPAANKEDPAPLLATSWKISDDGKEYTFSLKKGVKFHNGDELKASDVVFSAKRLLTIGEGFAYLFTETIDDMVAVDDYTVKFILKKPFGPFLSTLPRLYILNEKQVMENIDPKGTYGEYGDYGRNWLLTHDAGSGPYMAKELIQQEYLYAVKFDGWHGGQWDPDAPDAFKLIDNNDSVTVRTMLANKEVEFSDMWQSSETLTAMDQLPGVDIAQYSALATQNMFINTKKAPTDDIYFRKAISCLFDYDMVINNVFPGSTRSVGPTSKFVAGHTVTNQYNFDLEKAKEYLSQSKYANELDKYHVELLCNSEVADHEKVALAFQAAAQQIGIKVEISKAPWISIVDRVAKIETTPNLVSINNNAQYNEAGSILEATYHSKTTGTFENASWIQDKNLDAKIEGALATVDKKERFSKYAEIQNMIVNDICPTAWLGDTLDRVAYHSDYVYWPVAEAAKKGEPMSNLNGYHYYFFDMRVYPDKM